VEFGLGTGFFRQLHSNGLGCNGEPIVIKTPAQYSSIALSGEVWATEGLRLNAAYGSVRDETGTLAGRWEGCWPRSNNDASPRSGSQCIRWHEGSLSPAFALRAGTLKGPHLRAEYGFPSATMGLTATAACRTGPESREESRRPVVPRRYRYAGHGLTRKLGLFAELGLPLPLVHRKAGISLHALLAGSAEGHRCTRLARASGCTRSREPGCRRKARRYIPGMTQTPRNPAPRAEAEAVRQAGRQRPKQRIPPPPQPKPQRTPTGNRRGR
jgi:hypothetical protein